MDTKLFYFINGSVSLRETAKSYQEKEFSNFVVSLEECVRIRGPQNYVKCKEMSNFVLKFKNVRTSSSLKCTENCNVTN